MPPGQAPDGGAHEQLERDRRGHRVAGQPEDEDGTAAGRTFRRPERERLARLDRDPPEIDLPDRLHGGLHDVIRSDRHPARHDQRVRAGLEPAAQSSEHVVELVGGDPEIDRVGAGGADLGPQSRPVGVRDAGRPERLARAAGPRPRSRGRRPSAGGGPGPARRPPRPAGRRPAAPIGRAGRQQGRRRRAGRCPRRARTRRPARPRGRGRRRAAARSHRGRADRVDRHRRAVWCASTGTTASAPAGSRAPVAIRAAVPGRTVTLGRDARPYLPDDLEPDRRHLGRTRRRRPPGSRTRPSPSSATVAARRARSRPRPGPVRRRRPPRPTRCRAPWRPQARRRVPLRR